VTSTRRRTRLNARAARTELFIAAVVARQRSAASLCLEAAAAAAAAAGAGRDAAAAAAAGARVQEMLRRGAAAPLRRPTSC